MSEDNETKSADTEPRVALVTGAGKRVGRAIAQALGHDGFRVGVHYNGSAEGAEETAEAIIAAGGEAITLQQDLSDPSQAGKLIQSLNERFGQVSVLVNSAALFAQDNLRDLTPDSMRPLLDVNLLAPVFLMQAFANQSNIPQPAAIINILDTQMGSPYPERFSYFVSKFGLDGATRVAAFDLAGIGVTVNAIAPGLILPSEQTIEEFERRQRLTPLGEGLGLDDIVAGVRYLIAARQVTGTTLTIDAGQHLMGFGNT